MNNDSSVKIGTRIKSAREKADKTQKEIALLLGYKTPSIISEFESGKKDITASDLFKVNSCIFSFFSISLFYRCKYKRYQI